MTTSAVTPDGQALRIFRPGSTSFMAEITMVDQEFPAITDDPNKVRDILPDIKTTVIRVTATADVYLSLNVPVEFPAPPDVFTTGVHLPRDTIAYIVVYSGDILHWRSDKNQGILHLTRMI